LRWNALSKRWNALTSATLLIPRTVQWEWNVFSHAIRNNEMPTATVAQLYYTLKKTKAWLIVVFCGVKFDLKGRKLVARTVHHQLFNTRSR